MSEELHEGEIWRKPGPRDWCKIEQNITPEAPNYDGGLPGFGVRFGNYSFNRKRIYWQAMGYFVAVKNYADFVEWMKAGYRYLMVGKLSEQQNRLGLTKGAGPEAVTKKGVQ